MPTIRDTHEHLISVDSKGCWNWTGAKFKARGRITYGAVTLRKSTYPHTRKSDVWRAHCWSWEIAFGSIPEGKWVLHTCDNMGCVNPDHLFLGDHQLNTDDKVNKGRQSRTRGTDQPKHKLTPDQVLRIREDPRIRDEIAKDYGIGGRYVSFIKSRQRWGWL